MTLVLVLFCMACETQAVEPPVAVSDSSESKNIESKELAVVSTLCDQLHNQTWESVELLDAGRSLNGMAKMNWMIGFDAGQFRWRYADVVEMGSYRCEDGSLILSSAMNDPRATGKLSDDKSELIINGVRYVLKPE